jgi:hypothetical protein
MSKALKKASSGEAPGSVLRIEPLDLGVVEFCLLGLEPLIQNRMSEKARQQLLFPRGGRMSASDKKLSLKHDPETEFRNAAHAVGEREGATRLIIPAGAFAKALAEVALDTPGAAKTQIQRLTWVVAENNQVPVLRRAAIAP